MASNIKSTGKTAPEHLESHSCTLIFLHGRDSNASDFKTEFLESQASDNRFLTDIFPTIKWVFPTSKQLYAARFEQDLYQWFDIWSVEKPEERKELQIDGLKESIRTVLNIIREEATLVPLEQIILAGISQGCATAILSLLLGGMKLGGFIGFSSWLPFQEEINRDHSLQTITDLLDRNVIISKISSALETPVLIEHCKDDDVVPSQNGEILCSTLETLGMDVKWKNYNEGGHWINEPQGIDDMVSFIRNCLNIK